MGGVTHNQGLVMGGVIHLEIENKIGSFILPPYPAEMELSSMHDPFFLTHPHTSLPSLTHPHAPSLTHSPTCPPSFTYQPTCIFSPSPTTCSIPPSLTHYVLNPPSLTHVLLSSLPHPPCSPLPTTCSHPPSTHTCTNNDMMINNHKCIIVTFPLSA